VNFFFTVSDGRNSGLIRDIVGGGESSKTVLLPTAAFKGRKSHRELEESNQRVAFFLFLLLVFKI